MSMAQRNRRGLLPGSERNSGVEAIQREGKAEMRTKGLPSKLGLLIAGVWLLALPTGALAQRQVSPLMGPEVSVCDGPKVGKTVIKDLANGDTKLKVKFTSGPPGHTEKVYWLCKTVSGDCHTTTCGSIFVGQFTLDGTGFGVFKTILAGGNPFLGKFVLIEAGSGLPGEVFTARFGEVPAGAAPVAAEATAGAGDQCASTP